MNTRLLLAAACALSLAACDDSSSSNDAGPTGSDGGAADTGPSTVDGGAEERTIAEIASSDPNFSILAAAATRAGLVDALSGEGTFTIFAPTNEAFEASGLTAEAVEALPVEALTGILAYHALPVEVPSSDIVPGPATTLASLPIFLGTTDGVSVNGGDTVTGGADVVAADVEASNGVIHVIDRVLLPPTVEAIARYAGFTTLAGAVASQGLTEALSGAGPFTVFAPTNAAFAALGELPSGDALTNVLLFHVAPGRVASSAITASPVGLSTLSPAPWRAEGADTTLSLVARLDGTTARVHGAAVVVADIPATNGIVHVIDTVLVPTDLAGVASAAGFTSLLDAVGAAPEIADGVTVAGVLTDPESRLTVFAPTNAAFAALGTAPSGNALRDVLLFHVLGSPTPGIVLSTGLPAAATELPTQLSGSTLSFAPGTPPTVDGQDIVLTDLVATNGVVHVVDGVLTP